MDKNLLVIPSSESFEERIKHDISRRGLSTGDRYRGCSEVAHMLGVSASTGHRIMVRLAEQGYLVRKQGVGTLVGPRFARPDHRTMDSIYLCMPRLNQRLGLSLDDLIYGIHNALPDAVVTTTLFPRADPLPVFQRILAQNGGNMVGLGMILVPREIQELVARSGVPAVLLGTPHKTVRGLVSIDIDGYEMGRLLARFLAGRGHRRFALVLRENPAAGDMKLMRGFSEVLGQAGFACNALEFVHCDMEETLIREEVRDLLARPDAPTALVSYAFPSVEAGINAASHALELVDGEDFEWVSTLAAAYPHPKRSPLRCMYTPARIGGIFGTILAQVAQGRRPESEHTFLPVALREDAEALNPGKTPKWNTPLAKGGSG